MLFDVKERTRTDPKRPGEAEFAFYDSTARPEFEVYRQLVNKWIMELPEMERAEMVARLQKSDSLGYQAALAELTIHAALVRQGYKVDIHPPSGHATRRPDFLVRTREGEPVAIVEVTTFGPAQEEVAKNNREAAVYNAIDGVVLPLGFRLSYDVVEYGKEMPGVGKLRAAVKEWAAANAKEEAEEAPARVFEAGDWKIELKLFGGYRKDVPVTRAIGGAMGDVRYVKPEQEIRDALQKKGSRYGALNAPYLIVVADCKGELQGGEHSADALIDAVCGTHVISMAMPSGEVHERRESNGYWWRGGKSAHANVSAVVLLPQPHLWNLRDDRWQPLMIRHPWPQYPLPEGFLPLPGFQHQAEPEDCFVRKEGTRLADLLQLPNPWPPE